MHEPGRGQDAPGPAVQPMDDGNSSCVYCHIDFEGEEFVDVHLAQRITCRSCHGPSERHRQDETLMARPDRLFGRAEVGALCQQCHGPHRDPAAVEAFRSEWEGRARENGRFIYEDAVCTDCHGWHTIKRK